MSFLNIEIKARHSDLARARRRLQALDPEFVGEDHQVDTYFSVPEGRLKLRQGTIERSLIYYERPNQAGPKASEVSLYTLENDGEALRSVLASALGVWMVVDKRREIYFVENVKIHLDRVDQLGTFVEVEAIDEAGTRDREALEAQCQHFLRVLEVKEDDLVTHSYSDLLAAQNT